MSRTEELRERIRKGPALVLDAAMGTELERRGAAGALPLWSAAALLDAPRTVFDIHAADAAAGADILTANTFRTHRRSLARAGLGDQSELLSWRAVSLAREAADISSAPPFVVGSLSPLEDCYRPDLVPDDADLDREHALQAESLAAAGVDGILLETHNTVRELAAAARAAGATGLPVIASFMTDGAGRLLSGELIEDVVRALAGLEPDALAINCVPARFVEGDLARLAAAAPGVPLGAYGNVGQPRPDGSAERPDAAEYAELARRWIAAGARIVGGCCGTGPEYTASARDLTR
ncbi:MAG TPA: homocysteine S-methyltransferase family protein, partial [Thermoanaerobaculia bacterium]